jgi:hypothetical protein
MNIVVNMIRTPDGTILQSFSRWDFKIHDDKVSGERYMVDGGIDYIRRSQNKVPYKELSLTIDSPHEEIREHFFWGTYGKDGLSPYRRVLLKKMTSDHIEAILRTQSHLAERIRKVFQNELNYRGKLVKGVNLESI